jgi:hypothetical protein
MDEVYALIQPKSHNMNYWEELPQVIFPSAGGALPVPPATFLRRAVLAGTKWRPLELASFFVYRIFERKTGSL